MSKSTWMHKLRLKSFAVVIGVGLTALTLLSLTTIPAWPVVGVAVAAVALYINSAASRLSQDVCLGCGANIAEEPRGEHGVACPGCGAINDRPTLARGGTGESGQPPASA